MGLLWDVELVNTGCASRIHTLFSSIHALISPSNALFHFPRMLFLFLWCSMVLISRTAKNGLMSGSARETATLQYTGQCINQEGLHLVLPFCTSQIPIDMTISTILQWPNSNTIGVLDPVAKQQSITLGTFNDTNVDLFWVPKHTVMRQSIVYVSVPLT
jgi:hypothetical protein